jgi:flavin reductase (DIM6/NTAB) family NADH-FMN oxidoreductase RutF
MERGLLHMSKTTWKGGTLLGPLPPVLVTCGTMDEANIITIAWTGICNTIPPKTYISVRPGRYSYPIIKSSGEFVIHLTPASLIRAADWCGIHTGRKVDKFAKWNLTKEPASAVAPPLIAQCPLALECKVDQIIPLGSHDMFLADIVAVDVEESLIDASGKLHLERAELAAFAHGAYYSLGKRMQSFGFSVRKKPRKGQKGKNKAKRNN